MKKQNAPLGSKGALVKQHITLAFYQYAAPIATVSALIGIAAFLLVEVVK